MSRPILRVDTIATRNIMETRVRQRLRELQMKNSAGAIDSISDTMKMPPLEVSAATHMPTPARMRYTKLSDDYNNSEEEFCSRNETEDEEDESDESGGEDCDADGEGETDSCVSIDARKNAKTQPAAMIHIFYSNRSPSRPPLVWFPYPEHLDINPRPPLTNEGGTSRLVSIPSSDLKVYYKTHWERNCVKQAFAAAGLRRTKKKWTQWSVAWAKHIPRTKFKYLSTFNSHLHAFNHFPDPWVIGRKDRLTKTLAIARRKLGRDEYDFLPESFTLPDQFGAFSRAMERENSRLKASLWILKPPASACGRGIRVISSKDVDKYVTKHKKYVIQRYLSNPLLIDGVKFDIRLYAAVTSVNPLRIYMFNEGIARFCTEKFSLSDLKNRFRHLSNYSINKKSNTFVENEHHDEQNVGSKWSYSALLRYLEEKHITSDAGNVHREIEAIICKTILAMEPHTTSLVHEYVGGPTQCFELFGFDFMIDAELKPWLIEVNVSPSLMSASPLDKHIKGVLLSDLFHLVGVPVALDRLPKKYRPAPSVATSVSPPHPSASYLRRRLPPSNQKQPHRYGRTGSHSKQKKHSVPRGSRDVNRVLHDVVFDTSIKSFDPSHLDLFTHNDWDMIHAMDDENERSGNFHRVYPTSNPIDAEKYQKLFMTIRYSDALCSKWVQTAQHKVTATSHKKAGR